MTHVQEPVIDLDQYFPVSVIAAVKVGDGTTHDLYWYLENNFAPKKGSDVYVEKTYVQEEVAKHPVHIGGQAGQLIIANGNGGIGFLTLDHA